MRQVVVAAVMVKCRIVLPGLGNPEGCIRVWAQHMRWPDSIFATGIKCRVKGLCSVAKALACLLLQGKQYGLLKWACRPLEMA